MVVDCIKTVAELTRQEGKDLGSAFSIPQPLAISWHYVYSCMTPIEPRPAGQMALP
jgi:hypothetical protein